MALTPQRHHHHNAGNTQIPRMSPDPTVRMDTAEGDSTTKQTGQPQTGTGPQNRDSIHATAWICCGAPFECNSISHWRIPGNPSIVCSDKDGTLSRIFWMNTWLCCIDGNQHTTPKNPICSVQSLCFPLPQLLRIAAEQSTSFLLPTSHSTYPIMPTANS